MGSKADACDSSALAAFHLWAGQLFPPKQLVATARHGVVEDPAARQLANLLTWPTAASAGGQGGSCGVDQPEPGPGQRQQLAAQERLQSSAAGTPWLSSSAAARGSLLGAGEPAAESTPRGRQPERKQVQDASGTHAACG